MKNALLSAGLAIVAVGGVGVVISASGGSHCGPCLTAEPVPGKPSPVTPAAEPTGEGCPACAATAGVCDVADVQAEFARRADAETFVSFDEPPLAKPISQPVKPASYEVVGDPREVLPSPRPAK